MLPRCGLQTLGVCSTGLSAARGLQDVPASVTAAHRLTCSLARGVPQDHRLNPCLLHWLADSSPPGTPPYRGSLHNDIFLSSFTSVALTVTSNARVSLHTDSVSGETTPVSSDEEEGHEGSIGGSGKSLGSNWSKQGPTLTHTFNYLNDIVFLRRDGGHCVHQRWRV